MVVLSQLVNCVICRKGAGTAGADFRRWRLCMQIYAESGGHCLLLILTTDWSWRTFDGSSTFDKCLSDTWGICGSFCEGFIGDFTYVRFKFRLKCLQEMVTAKNISKNVTSICTVRQLLVVKFHFGS